MLVSLNWLKEFVDIKMAPFDFGEALTMSGTKVETLTVVSENVVNIFTGQITKIEAHPNADKLTVCTVDMGTDQRVIVTAAKNVFEGAIVPVAIDGAVIANGTKIGTNDFRGLLSYGMFCSIEELGMNTDLFSKEIMEGILILPENTPLGMDARELLWLDDVIIDVELTANRSDCQSIVGIAREAAATLDLPMAEVPVYDATAESANEIPDYLAVRIEDQACPRYVAKMLKVKKIEDSPLWMQIKLLNSGVRPINNIVDVTNYVMLELGQPLHAFDYHSLKSQEIVVTTTADKKIVTLDDKEREIDESMLMITNGKAPVAIAGVMGGENSEITDKTSLIVLESANFNKGSVRLTAKQLGLRTEASSRFEKGVDPELAAVAALRATQLLLDIGACDVIEGMIDVYPQVAALKKVALDVNWFNAFVGISLTVEEVSSMLTRLFFTVNKISDAVLEVEVPSYRMDIELKEDLAEEVVRIFGYDRIPGTIMGGETMVGGKTPVQKFEDSLKNILVGQGYFETLTSSFTSEKRLQGLNTQLPDNLIPLINPLGEENSIMRHTLIGHQLEVISLNYNRKNPAGCFFELSNTYRKNTKPGELPVEAKKLAISSYGSGDYFELKGVVELLLEHFGIYYPEFVAGGSDFLHPGRKAEIFANGTKLGEIGEIHPMVVKHYELPKRCYVCQLSFDELFECASLDNKFTDLPKFPASNRDLAILLKAEIPAAAIAAIIRKNSGEILESIELFDVYTGAQIPAGYKSLAYALNFRHHERTLTDNDINPVIDQILGELKQAFDAQLRE
ncbi:phenylalanine--tRNA ligase subunit beta [Acetobacterium wieringae]|uniref:phenylalanine--tRNA ligase subunit beta n=1 Tax=Acetobacterium wieringae TaxID=52694 RepID=UPI002B21485B|nr:phenylalanine--tRNA ligase subunit beta [Acetobacterium wieringae]MEA4804907.1 phenylalanine--tRNA ligase subunit beta [Acetobacterium wieringae]